MIMVKNARQAHRGAAYGSAEGAEGRDVPMEAARHPLNPNLIMCPSCGDTAGYGRLSPSANYCRRCGQRLYQED